MLLVSTSHSLLLVDVKNQQYIKLHQGHGLYYGIALNDSGFYLAARRRLVSSEEPQDNERGEILIFDAMFQIKGVLNAPFALRDLHHIAWHNDRLWMTCSYDNMIATWDRSGWRKWFPFGESVEPPLDRNHFNTIGFFKNQVCLVAHNKGNSELCYFSEDDLSFQKKIPLGVQAHNVWEDGDEVFTCSSGEGRILGSNGFELEIGGFPRGIEFDNDHCYVGISTLAERDQRDFTTPMIQVYDTAWRLINALHFDREGLLLDIRKVDVNKAMWGLLKLKYPSFSC